MRRAQSKFLHPAIDVQGANFQVNTLAFFGANTPLDRGPLAKVDHVRLGHAQRRAAEQQNSQDDVRKLKLKSMHAANLCIRRPSAQGHSSHHVYRISQIRNEFSDCRFTARESSTIILSRLEDEPPPETTDLHLCPIPFVQGHGPGYRRHSAAHAANSRGGRQRRHHAADAGTAGHPRL